MLLVLRHRHLLTKTRKAYVCFQTHPSSSGSCSTVTRREPGAPSGGSPGPQIRPRRHSGSWRRMVQRSVQRGGNPQQVSGPALTPSNHRGSTLLGGWLQGHGAVRPGDLHLAGPRDARHDLALPASSQSLRVRLDTHRGSGSSGLEGRHAAESAAHGSAKGGALAGWHRSQGHSRPPSSGAGSGYGRC